MKKLTKKDAVVAVHQIQNSQKMSAEEITRFNLQLARWREIMYYVPK